SQAAYVGSIPITRSRFECHLTRRRSHLGRTTGEVPTGSTTGGPGDVRLDAKAPQRLGGPEQHAARDERIASSETLTFPSPAPTPPFEAGRHTAKSPLSLRGTKSRMRGNSDAPTSSPKAHQGGVCANASTR